MKYARSFGVIFPNEVADRTHTRDRDDAWRLRVWRQAQHLLVSLILIPIGDKDGHDVWINLMVLQNLQSLILS